MTLTLVRTWISKENGRIKKLEEHLYQRITMTRRGTVLPLQLLASSFGLTNSEILLHETSNKEENRKTFRLFALGSNDADVGGLPLEELWDLHDTLALESPFGNAAAASGLAIALQFLPDHFARVLFRRQLVVLNSTWGPRRDHTLNLALLAANGRFTIPKEVTAAARKACTGSERFEKKNNGRDRELSLQGAFELLGIHRHGRPSARPRMRGLGHGHRGALVTMGQYHDALLEQIGSGTIQQFLWSAEFITDGLIPTVTEALALQPEPHWAEALRYWLSHTIPDLLGEQLAPENWKTKLVLDGSKLVENDAYLLAWLLLLDIWVYDEAGLTDPSSLPFSEIADFAQDRSEGPLQLALALRNYALGLSADRDLEQLSLSRDMRSILSRAVELGE